MPDVATVAAAVIVVGVDAISPALTGCPPPAPPFGNSCGSGLHRRSVSLLSWLAAHAACDCIGRVPAAAAVVLVGVYVTGRVTAATTAIVVVASH